MISDVEIFARRLQHVYIPYQLYGRDRAQGFDCEGFVRWMFAQGGRVLPEGQGPFLRAFMRVPQPYQPWDVPMFRIRPTWARHIGVMQDSAWFWHCGLTVHGVGRCELSRPFWARQFLYMLRLRVELC